MANPPSRQKFVDDTLIFNHSSVKEAHSIKRILDSFSTASGSTINLDKSLIFFFHTPLATQRNIKCIKGFSMGNIPFKYLGIPVSTSATKHSFWKNPSGRDKRQTQLLVISTSEYSRQTCSSQIYPANTAFLSIFYLGYTQMGPQSSHKHSTQFIVRRLSHQTKMAIG